jgi:glucokinase
VTAIGIDVGGTKCLGVALDDTGVVVAEVREPTPSAPELVGLLARMWGDLGGNAPLGVGLPGLITPAGVVRASPNLRGARDIAVGPALREVLGTAVHVDNDATCAALAEWRVGAARGTRDALMVTLGTGIGGGIVMGGRLQRGSHGFAGEIGHMMVERGGLECVCGRRGCWERYASGSALRTLSGGRSGEEVFASFLAGDESSAGVVSEWAGWIAMGLASLTNICDPEVIVLGGGTVDSVVPVMEEVREKFSRALYSPEHRTHPRLETAVLGARAGAIGAAMLTEPGIGLP